MTSTVRDIKVGDTLDLNGVPIRITAKRIIPNRLIGNVEIGLKTAAAIELIHDGGSIVCHPSQTCEKL